VFLDGEKRPDDYEIRHDGQSVGRIDRMRSTCRELWRWTQSGPRAPTYGLNCGVAGSLDEAKAAFRAAWARRVVSTPNPCASSLFCATPVVQIRTPLNKMG
jgi:hypothetical protein